MREAAGAESLPLRRQMKLMVKLGMVAMAAAAVVALARGLMT